MSFLKQEPHHALLHIKVTPNSSRTKISGKFTDEKNQEYLKVNLAAAPEDGKANEELIKFLSKLLKIPKSKIEIIRGDTSRTKLVKASFAKGDGMRSVMEDFLKLHSE
jgi:hypothetical protein